MGVWWHRRCLYLVKKKWAGPCPVSTAWTMLICLPGSTIKAGRIRWPQTWRAKTPRRAGSVCAAACTQQTGIGKTKTISHPVWTSLTGRTDSLKSRRTACVPQFPWIPARTLSGRVLAAVLRRNQFAISDQNTSLFEILCNNQMS